MIERLYVDKTNQTFADALLAYGLAAVSRDVLERITGDDEVRVTLKDAGPYYVLELAPGLETAQLSVVGYYAPEAPLIRTEKNAAQLPSDVPQQAVVAYEAERDKRAAFFEARRALSAEAREAERSQQAHPELEHLASLTPHEHWDVFRAINPAALIGYNKLAAQWWALQEALPEALELLFTLFSATPNDTNAAVAAWKALDKAHGWQISATTSALQIYNPAQGKGQNRAKADKLVMGNIKDAFWMAEWLKAVGFYRCALTKQLRGVKDRKTYALRPAEIGFRESEDVMNAFKAEMARAQTSVQSDVLAALRYTRTLLQYSRTERGRDLAAQLFKREQPARIVAGLYVAFYKDLGNSAATMNLAFIGLPGWIRVRNADDVRDALIVLAEHERIVRQFDESHSDDVNLLLSYRDFISSSDLWPFLEFTTAYSGYIIRQRERPRGRARQFTDDNLRRLMVSAEPKLATILDTPGFQHIAYAIRQSTVVAQYRKQQGDRRYDVRYGLNQDLARKANYPDDFIAALGDFLHKYNAENAQVMETRSGPYRRSIVTSDIEDIVALVDAYGSALICQLLLAYGYARSPRPDGDGDGDEAPFQA